MAKRVLMLLFLCLGLFPTFSFAKVIATTSPLPPPNLVNMDWGIQYTNILKWWRQGDTGKGVKIAVLDTGIDYKHPDLIPSIAGGVSFIPNENWYDQNGHGTHVTGIIAAQNSKSGVLGMAYGAKIYAVKVMDKNGVGTVADLIAGIHWSITHHMNIINMSLALTPDEQDKFTFRMLQAAIHVAYTRGILVVAAAGNDGINQVSYPAAFPDVIAVGSATDHYDGVKYTLESSYFSNWGSKIEVVAPGSFVYSTYPIVKVPTWSDTRGYEYLSGTSMAAPYVTGFLADLKQKYPRDTPAQLRYLLHLNTIPIGPRDRTGYGFIFAK